MWLKGIFIGGHDGGFTTFQFAIAEIIRQKNNIIVVRTDTTRRIDQIPSISFDWFNWGGISRDFKSTKRTNQFQQGFNRKGIVSGEKNEKKLVFYSLPKILNEKRKIINTRLIGIILWIILLPLSFFIFTRLIDFFLNYIEKKPSYEK